MRDPFSPKPEKQPWEPTDIGIAIVVFLVTLLVIAPAVGWFIATLLQFLFSGR